MIIGPQISDYIGLKALLCNNYCNSDNIAEIIVLWEEMVSLCMLSIIQGLDQYYTLASNSFNYQDKL